MVTTRTTSLAAVTSSIKGRFEVVHSVQWLTNFYTRVIAVVCTKCEDSEVL